VNSADRILLEGLRLVSDASDEVWELVVAEVTKAGSVVAVGGQARVEIERAVAKARTLVEKHPGQHDQSVHGGKKGGGGAPASDAKPSTGGGGAGDADVPVAAKLRLDKVDSILSREPAAYTSSKDIAREKDKMKRATKEEAIASAKNAHKEHRQALEMETSRKQIAYDMERTKSPKADAALADARKYGTESAVQFHLAGAWGAVARSLGATGADLAVEKAVLPVVKHPGHGDQSVHGSGKRTKAPTDSTGAPDWKGDDAQGKAYKNVHTAGKQSSKRMVESANTMTRETAGRTKAGSTEDVELSFISSEVDRVIADVADIPAGKKRALNAISNHRARIQQAGLSALQLSPENKASSLKALRAVSSELKALEATVNQAWSGVPDLD